MEKPSRWKSRRLFCRVKYLFKMKNDVAFWREQQKSSRLYKFLALDKPGVWAVIYFWFFIYKPLWASLLYLAFRLGKLSYAWWVRRSVPSQQFTSVEHISKTASAVSRERMEWWYPGTDAAKAGVILLVFLRIGAGWWIWRTSQFALHDLIGLTLFVVFIAMGIVDLLSVNFPRVVIDEEGITGSERLWRRRRASWRDIACCEVKRVRKLLGEGFDYQFKFKDESGRVILDLEPASLRGLNGEELEEIETEIKRRLTSTLPVTP